MLTSGNIFRRLLPAILFIIHFCATATHSASGKRRIKEGLNGLPDSFRTGKSTSLGNGSGSEKIHIPHDRVYGGTNATASVRSACFVIHRIRYGEFYVPYWSWEMLMPCAIIGDKYVLTEQANLLSWDYGTLTTDPKNLAIILSSGEGVNQMHFVSEIYITTPQYTYDQDLNDIAILELVTPINFGCHPHFSPAVVSCDDSDLFAGNTPNPPPPANNGWGSKAESYRNSDNGEGSQSNDKTSGDLHDNKGWNSGWGWNTKELQCIYVSWGVKDGTYVHAESDISPTFTPVKIYNYADCRKKYQDVGYYMSEYTFEKFCVVTANGYGPDCYEDYNGHTHCYLGQEGSTRRLLVGGMTYTEEYCPTKYPSVMIRYAFYPELFSRIGYECCNPKKQACNCSPEYSSLPDSIGPYYCPTK